MTECERIINEGILPASFFEEETICDFLVTKERKKLWAVGIDILINFDRVCRNNKLRYSLAFGCLLGCIRHNGFIPWDDDIDVFMPREDYESLKKHVSDFPEPYFLQFPGFDNEYSFSFAKLRNSNTTGVSFPFRYGAFNQGFFIDIFPLDNFSPENIEADIETIKHLVSESSAYMRRGCPCPSEDDKKKMELFPNKRSGEYIRVDLDRTLRKYENDFSESYIAWSILTYHYKHLIFKKNLFDDMIDYSFYGHPVLIPRQYEEVLTIIYDDYMKLPPIEKRGAWHSKEIFDPDIPYKKMLDLLRNKDRF
jgi:lipopolysaccharide cholinephosphotransferase